MTITKTDLTSSIHNRLDLPKSQASRLVESLLENIKKTLASGEDILISGFGKFCVKDKKIRKGRNPQTGGDLILDGRRVVTFRYSSGLKEKMNGSTDTNR
ncbi:MAG: integration host factor subunit alpha [Desulfobacteraceae bacterium]|nr:integration host factor subunit alpha [Desulfobacteraceae bacterium]